MAVTLESLPPGPPGPRIRHTLGWVTRPGPWTRRLRARYGDTFSLRITNEAPWVMLGDPDAVKEVFTGDPDTLHAGEGNQVLKPLLGPRSVLLLDGADHMAERKALLPPFHGERMQAYGELIADIAAREVASWPRHAPVAVRPRMQELTLSVIMQAVFGVRDETLRATLARTLEWTTDPRRLLYVVLAGPDRVDRAFRRAREPVR
jgi:cytochrome P450